MELRAAAIQRRRKGPPLKKRLAVAAVRGRSACAALTAIPWGSDQVPAPASGLDVATAPAAAPALAATAAQAGRGATRHVYPYSIVPGGVSSRGDVAHMIKADKVVAVHYAAFDVSKVRTLKVSKPRAVHVSYRKGDKVYWTAKKVMLAEGETLLSDGSSEIRARCGNRISDVARLPVEADGPSEEELDSPVEVAADEAADGGPQDVAYVPDGQGNTTLGQAFRLQTFAAGTGLAPAGNQPTPVSLGELMLASSLDGSTSRNGGWLQFGSGSTSGSPSGSNLPASPAGTSNEGTSPGPAGTTTQPTPSTGAGGTSGTGSTPGAPLPGTPALPGTTELPAPDADPVPPTPDRGPERPATIPETLLPPSAPDVKLDDTAPARREVPEPGTPWLCGAAAMAMLLKRRARR